MQYKQDYPGYIDSRDPQLNIRTGDGRTLMQELMVLHEAIIQMKHRAVHHHHADEPQFVRPCLLKAYHYALTALRLPRPQRSMFWYFHAADCCIQLGWPERARSIVSRALLDLPNPFERKLLLDALQPHRRLLGIPK